MGANIEIKARARDFARQCQLAASISDQPAEIIDQEDIFFHVTTGRLKLRIFDDAHGELIFYERADTDKAKQSRYTRSKTEEPLVLKELLSAALGVKGIVKKRRLLYMFGQTRIHCDDVAGLGHFIELEYVLRDGEEPQHAVVETESLQRRLEIGDEDLIAGAYLDLL